MYFSFSALVGAVAGVDSSPLRALGKTKGRKCGGEGEEVASSSGSNTARGERGSARTRALPFHKLRVTTGK